jgi:hypothetical protein
VLPIVLPEHLTPEEYRGVLMVSFGVTGFSETHLSKVSNNVHGASRFIVKVLCPRARLCIFTVTAYL